MPSRSVLPPARPGWPLLLLPLLLAACSSSGDRPVSFGSPSPVASAPASGSSGAAGSEEDSPAADSSSDDSGDADSSDGAAPDGTDGSDGSAGGAGDVLPGVPRISHLRSGQGELTMTVGTVTARDAQERAVAAVFLRYELVLGRAQVDGYVDPADLNRLATGQAASFVTEAAAGPRLAGRAALDVTEVAVTGSSATLQACYSGQGHEVGEAGTVSSSGRMTVSLERSGTRWRVTRAVGYSGASC